MLITGRKKKVNVSRSKGKESILQNAYDPYCIMMLFFLKHPMEASVSKAKHFALPVEVLLLQLVLRKLTQPESRIRYDFLLLHSDHFRTFTPEHGNVTLHFAEHMNNQPKQTGIVAAS